MTINKVNNIFSIEELNIIKNIINEDVVKDKNDKFYKESENNGTGIHLELGRIQVANFVLPEFIYEKLNQIANNLSEVPLTMSHCIYAKYSNAYGSPNLPAHFDHDTNDLVIDFQLESNTVWDLGIDQKLYELEDNSAIIFNANKYIHWRPHKKFKDGEYVKMLFIRFGNPEKRSDYSYLDYIIGHEVFEEVNKYRDSLLERQQ